MRRSRWRVDRWEISARLVTTDSPPGPQHPVEAMDEFLITVMKQVSFPQQEAITIIRQLPRTLCHQDIIGMGSDPC